MSGSQWFALPKIERDVLICAMEAGGLLTYALQHDTEIDQQQGEGAVVGQTVLALVDRGWITVHRLIPDPDGTLAFLYSPAIVREDLDGLLADPDTWDDPSDWRWYGELALDLTPTGLSITRS